MTSRTHGNYIGGHWNEGQDAAPDINPSDTRDVVGLSARASRADAEAAVAAATRRRARPGRQRDPGPQGRAGRAAGARGRQGPARRAGRGGARRGAFHSTGQRCTASSTVIRVRDADEALAVANDTAFGLSSGVCTTSLKSAARLETAYIQP